MNTGRAGIRWIVTLVCLLSWAGMPAGAAAQELEVETDARLEGYGESLLLEESNLAMTWLAFIFLSAVAVLGLFKDAKRSHLD